LSKKAIKHTKAEYIDYLLINITLSCICKNTATHLTFGQKLLGETLRVNT